MKSGEGIRLRKLLRKIEYKTSSEISVSDWYNAFSRVSKWYEINDLGHRTNHMLDVLENLITIGERIEFSKKNIKLNWNALLVAVMMHDMFVWKDRKNHHKLAANYVDEFMSMIDNKRIPSYLYRIILNVRKDSQLIKDIILLHRASDRHTLQEDINCKVFRAADNGEPDDNIIVRVLTANTCELALKHLKEKYGSKGYIWKDRFYYRLFKDKADRFIKTVDDLTLESLYIKLNSYK